MKYKKEVIQLLRIYQRIFKLRMISCLIRHQRRDTTTLRVSEEGKSWSNKAELHIGLIKDSVGKDIRESYFPHTFWYWYVDVWARINNRTAKKKSELHGSYALTLFTGDESEISNIFQFGWYDWCYYNYRTSKYLFTREVLGWVLVPVKREGNDMDKWIIKPNGNVLPRQKLMPLKVTDVHSETDSKKRDTFDSLMDKMCWISVSLPTSTVKGNCGNRKEYSNK